MPEYSGIRTMKQLYYMTGKSENRQPAGKSIRGIRGKLPSTTERKGLFMYTKDTDFFKRMNHDVAYVLGFTLADGCIYIDNKVRYDKNGNRSSKAGKYSIAWSSIDREVLEYIKSCFKTDQPLNERKKWYYRKYEHLYDAKPAWVLCIHSKEIVFDIMSLGITPKKSKTCVFDLGIPDEYMPDYIRGYFDGDGSIGEYEVKNKEATNLRSCFASGSRLCLEQLGQYLKDTLHIIPKIRQNQRGCYYLNYGIKETVALCRFMYKDIQSFTISRKKQVFDDFMSKRPGFCIRTCCSCSREFVATTGLQNKCKPCKALDKGRKTRWHK